MDFTFHWFGLQRKLVWLPPSLRLFCKKPKKCNVQAGKMTCGDGLAAHPAGKGEVPLALGGGRAVTQSLGLTHTHTHPRCHLPQQKIKVLATTRRPQGERRVNRSMMLRAHAARGTAGVTNKQTCGQCQQGERCQSNSGSDGTLHCSKPRCPLLLLAAEQEQSAPPSHTARGHCVCLGGDASSTGVLGRNLQKGTVAHHPHVCHVQAPCLKPHIFVQIHILFKKSCTYIYIDVFVSKAVPGHQPG